MPWNHWHLFKPCFRLSPISANPPPLSPVKEPADRWNHEKLILERWFRRVCPFQPMGQRSVGAIKNKGYPERNRVQRMVPTVGALYK